MRTPAILITSLLLATATPVTANDPVLDANEAFFADQVAALGVDPTSPEASAAIAEAATRAGDVRLDQVVSTANGGTSSAFGDIWIIETGPGSCPPVIVWATDLPGVSAAPQASVYGGDLGTASSNNPGLFIDWTTKNSGSYDKGVTVTGVSDFWCAEFFGTYLWFPFLTGIMTTN